MLVNYHVHDQNSSDACGTLEEIIQEAIKNNIKYFAISNHAEDVLHVKAKLDVNETIERLQKGREEYEVLKAKYPQICMKYAYEADMDEEFHLGHEQIQAAVEFDFVIGSIHSVDDYGVSGDNVIAMCKQYEHQDDLVNRYFEALLDGLKWGKFHHIGHFDVFKRFSSEYYGERYNFRKHADILKKIAKVIIEKEFVVEINCASLFCPVNEPAPHDELIEFLIECGVKKWTLGSDSHCPTDFPKGLIEGRNILEKHNIKAIFYE